MRLAFTLALTSIVLLACGPTGVSDSASQTSSTTTSSSSGSSSGSTSDATSTSETGPVPNPCGCEAPALCVATCNEGGPSIPAPEAQLEDFLCIDDPACVPGELDSPACRKAACGSVFYELEASCSHDGDEGVDIICSENDPLFCTVNAQDCPEGTKCVFLPAELEEPGPVCVWVIDDGAPGDPCTGAGAYDFTDSCGAESMCWPGALTLEPFEGTCLQFCFGMSSMCPMGSSCTPLAEGVELCVPDMP